MKKLFGAILALMTMVLPAAANAVTFNYAFTFDQAFPGGQPTGDTYSASGTFDATAIETSSFLTASATRYRIDAASGIISSSFDPNLGTIVAAVGNTGAEPSFVLLSNSFLLGTDFTLLADGFGAYGVGGNAFTGYQGFYGEAFGRVTSGSITAAAVPELCTWAMLLLGCGVAGTALRRRNALRYRAALA